MNMLLGVRLLIGLLLSLFLASSGMAAEFRVTRADPQGRFATIMISGRIEDSDPRMFKSMVAALKPDFQQISVSVNSEGGKVLAAMEMGNLIRDNWLWTELSDSPGVRCYSSCVFLLVAGATRVAGDWSPIGIHRPFFEANLFAGLSATEAKTKYDSLLAGVKAYLDKMGLATELYQAMIRVPSNELRILTAAEIDRWGINGKDPAYEEYVRAKNVSKYGQNKMREFDQYLKESGACLTSCSNAKGQTGAVFEQCAAICDQKYKNPLSDSVSK